MKATICDVNLLKNLQPSVIEAYLQATGWHERNCIPDRVSIWTRDTFSEDKLKIQEGSNSPHGYSSSSNTRTITTGVKRSSY